MNTKTLTIAKAGVTPPKDVQAACRRGLDLAPEHGGDGLTDAAKGRARSMAQGQAVSPETLKRIKAYHARHTYEKSSSPPSPGYVAYMLWGGEAGRRWANKEVARMDKSLEPDRASARAEDDEARPAGEKKKKTDLMKKPRDAVAKAAKKKGRGGKKKLVGGNKGAWATAQEKAKGKRNPEAYAKRVYANMTKKTAEVADAAREVLQKFLIR